MDILHRELTDRIINAFYDVYNHLGYGFLEKVYERALCLELTGRGMDVRTQDQIKVYYRSKDVGNYFADLTVEGKVILEIKTTDTLIEEHHKQLQNYLKATSIEVGLLLNFGPKPQIARKIFTNDRKRLPPEEDSPV